MSNYPPKTYGISTPDLGAPPEPIKPVERITGSGSSVGGYDEAIDRIFKEERVSPALGKALIKQESAGNPRAMSNKGAYGLGQFLPSTFKEVYPDGDPNNPEHQIRASARYLRKIYDSDPSQPLENVLAAYNAGPGRVKQYGGVPPYKETQDYVKRIGANLQNQPQPNNSTDAGNATSITPMPAPGSAQSRAGSFNYKESKAREAQRDAYLRNSFKVDYKGIAKKHLSVNPELSTADLGLETSFKEARDNGDIEGMKRYGQELAKSGYEYGIGDGGWPYIKRPAGKVEPISQGARGFAQQIDAEAAAKKLLEQRRAAYDKRVGPVMGAVGEALVDTAAPVAQFLGRVGKVPGRMAEAEAKIGRKIYNTVSGQPEPTTPAISATPGQGARDVNTWIEENINQPAQEKIDIAGGRGTFGKIHRAAAGTLPLLVGGPEVAGALAAGESYGAGEDPEKALFHGLATAVGLKAGGQLGKVLETMSADELTRFGAHLAGNLTGPQLSHIIETGRVSPMTIEDAALALGFSIKGYRSGRNARQQAEAQQRAAEYQRTEAAINQKAPQRLALPPAPGDLTGNAPNPVIRPTTQQGTSFEGYAGRGPIPGQVGPFVAGEQGPAVQVPTRTAAGQVETTTPEAMTEQAYINRLATPQYAEAPPIPETPETINAQIDALKAGRKVAVLLTPGAPDIAAPSGYVMLRSKVGRIIYDPRKTNTQEVISKVRDGSYGDLLGYVAPKPAENEPGVVVSAQRDGQEVQTAVVPPEAAQAQGEQFKQQYPDSQVNVTSVEGAKPILQARQSEGDPVESQARQILADFERDNGRLPAGPAILQRRLGIGYGRAVALLDKVKAERQEGNSRAENLRGNSGSIGESGQVIPGSQDNRSQDIQFQAPEGNAAGNAVLRPEGADQAEVEQGPAYRLPGESIESYWKREMAITAPDRRVPFEKFKAAYDESVAKPTTVIGYRVNRGPEMPGKGTYYSRSKNGVYQYLQPEDRWRTEDEADSVLTQETLEFKHPLQAREWNQNTIKDSDLAGMFPDLSAKERSDIKNTRSSLEYDRKMARAAIEHGYDGVITRDGEIIDLRNVAVEDTHLPDTGNHHYALQTADEAEAGRVAMDELYKRDLAKGEISQREYDAYMQMRREAETVPHHSQRQPRAEDGTFVPGKPSPDYTKRNPRIHENTDILTAVKELGGINLKMNPGEMRAIRESAKGRPGLINKDGYGADEMARLLEGHGFGPFRESGTDNLAPSVLDVLDEAARGKKIYNSEHDWEDDIISDILAHDQEFQGQPEAKKTQQDLFDAYQNNETLRAAYDKLLNGEPTQEDYERFRQEAKYGAGFSDELTENAIKAAEDIRGLQESPSSASDREAAPPERGKAEEVKAPEPQPTPNGPRRGYKSGPYNNEIVFASEHQRDMFDLGANLRGRYGREQSQSERKATQDKVDAETARLAKVLGMDAAAVRNLAKDVHDDVKAQMKGAKDESRTMVDNVAAKIEKAAAIRKGPLAESTKEASKPVDINSTYEDIRATLEDINRNGSKASLKAAEPLLRAIWPDFTETEKPNTGNDFAYGIWRMANVGDEAHRLPMQDLSRRIREARERASQPTEQAKPEQPQGLTTDQGDRVRELIKEFKRQRKESGRDLQDIAEDYIRQGNLFGKEAELTPAQVDMLRENTRKGDYGNKGIFSYPEPDSKFSFVNSPEVSKALGLGEKASSKDVMNGIAEAVGKDRFTQVSPKELKAWADEQGFTDRTNRALEYSLNRGKVEQRNLELGGKESDPDIIKDYRVETASDSSTNMFADPVKAFKATVVLGYDIYSGVKRFAQWSTEMLEKLGAKVKPYLSKAWTELKRIHQDEGGYLGELQRKQTETRQFKEWYKGAALVDGSGYPVRVYHGTQYPHEIQEFKTGGPDYAPRDPLDIQITDPIGLWVTPNPEFANELTDDGYGTGTGSVYPLYFNGKNLKEYENRHDLTDDISSSKIFPPEIIDAMREVEGEKLWRGGRPSFETQIKDVAEGKEPIKEGQITKYRPADYADNRPGLDLYGKNLGVTRTINQNASMAVYPIHKHLGVSYQEAQRMIVEAFKDAASKYKEELKSQGFDGVRIKNDAGFGEAIIVFEPTQIKSAIGNTGEFSKTNPNILRSGFDPVEGFKQTVALGKEIYGLTKDFTSWSKGMIEQFGEKVRPMLKRAWDEVKRLHEDERGFVRYSAEQQAPPQGPTAKRIRPEQTGKLKPGEQAKLFETAKPAEPVLKPEAPSDARMPKEQPGLPDMSHVVNPPPDKGWVEKAADLGLKARRSVLLSSIKTIAKLGSTASQRIAGTPIEEIIGSALSKIPGISQIAAQAPREGQGFSLKAEASALKGTFSKETVKQMLQQLKTGVSDLDVKFADKEPENVDLLEIFGRAHAGMKQPAKINEYLRSVSLRTDAKIKELVKGGMSPSDAMVEANKPYQQAVIGAKSYLDAKRSILMQDNGLVEVYKDIQRKLESKGTLGKSVSKGMQFMMPIVKVPSNFVVEASSYAAGAVKAGAKINDIGGMKALAQVITGKGLENVAPEDADYIMRNLKKQTIGAAVMAIGFLNPTAVGGYYQEGDNKDKDKVKAGGVRVFGVDVPRFLLHTPLMEMLQIGATVRQVYDKQHKKNPDQSTLENIRAGGLAAAIGLAKEIPFFDTPLRIAEAAKHYEGAKKFIGETARGVVIPPDVQNIAKEGIPFTGGKLGDLDEYGRPIKRNTEGFWDEMQSGIPVWRRGLEGQKLGTPEQEAAKSKIRATREAAIEQALQQLRSNEAYKRLSRTQQKEYEKKVRASIAR